MLFVCLLIWAVFIFLLFVVDCVVLFVWVFFQEIISLIKNYCEIVFLSKKCLKQKML